MSITSFPNDSYKSLIGGYYTGFFYYMLDSATLNRNGIDNSTVLGYCPTIQSICFNPFVDSNVVNVKEIDFDVDRFGKPIKLTSIPKVYRIETFNLAYKNLYYGNILERPNPWSGPNYQNESKLLFYPYRYLAVNDYINPPLVVKPQGMVNNNNEIETFNVNVKSTISDKCTYSIYIPRYQGDEDGNVEGLVNTASLDLPVGSDAYAQFMATSKAQMRTGTQYQLLQNQLGTNLGIASSVASGIGSLINMDFGGIASAGVEGYGAYAKGKLNRQQIVAEQMAQVSDLRSTPRTMASTGNDAIFSLNNGNKSIDLIEFTLRREALVRIGNYFHLYGYKQNKFMEVDLKSRYYFNYVKYLDCNITSSSIPKKDLDEIKQVFESGITFWHVFRNGVEVFDYTYDNVEVY